MSGPADRDALISAFMAGALAVHEWWQKADPIEREFATRDDDPDFTEAAHDYAEGANG